MRDGLARECKLDRRKLLELKTSKVLLKVNQGRYRKDDANYLDKTAQQESSFVTVVQFIPVVLDEFPGHLTSFHTETTTVKIKKKIKKKKTKKVSIQPFICFEGVRAEYIIWHLQRYVKYGSQIFQRTAISTTFDNNLRVTLCEHGYITSKFFCTKIL